MATGAEYPLSGRISTLPSIRGCNVYISAQFSTEVAPRCAALLQYSPFPHSLLHSPVWQICQDILRGMRYLAGHRREQRQTSRLRCCLSPPIACCEAVSSIIFPALASGWRPCPMFPLRLKLRAARRDVDPQLHKGMLRPSETGCRGA